MTERSWSACLTTSKPATVARPASGLSSVARMRTVVVLPAPFGPSRPRTVPSATVRSSAVERADLALAGPVDLDQAFGRDGIHGQAVAPCGAIALGGPQVYRAPARLRPCRSFSPAAPSRPPGSTAGARSSRSCWPSSSCGSGSVRCCRSCPSTSPSRASTSRSSAWSSPPGRRPGSSASRSSAGWPTGPRASR